VREAEKSREFCKPNSKSPPNAEKILCAGICDRPVTIGLILIISVTDCDRSATIFDIIIFLPMIQLKKLCFRLKFC